MKKTKFTQKSEEEWKKTLAPDQYQVLRLKGTETPYSGKLLTVKDDGTFHCAACGNLIFSSKSKYDSGCGWPSFWDVVDKNAIVLTEDVRYGMQRTEVTCTWCGSHLGHVFDDGPKNKTGVRYCMNSVALDFSKAK